MSLLDDVSIVVTPNGYKAGTLFGVIPVPTEGAELVTNGDFATDSDWNLDSSFSISGGLLTQNGTAGRTFQAISALEGGLGTYIKVTFTVEAISSGSFQINCYGVLSPVVTTTGTYTFTGVTSDITNLYVNNGGGFANGSISNISVKTFLSADMDVTRETAATRVDENGLVNYAEVIGGEEITNGDFATDTDWTKGTGWTISGGTANFTPSGSFINLTQSGILTSGKNYTVVYTLSNVTAGNVRARLGTQDGGSASSDGTYTSIITANGADFSIRTNGTFSGSVDNVSIKETARDNVPRIDYTGGGCPHILAEPMRTNNLESTQDFTDSFWQLTRVETVVASTVLSPDGTTFGFKTIPNSENNTHYLWYDYNLLSMPSGVEVTYSVFARPFGYTNFQLASSTSFASRYQNFELTGNGVIGTGDVNSAKIEKIGDWYKCSITETTTGTTPRVLNIATPSSGLGRNPSFTGNGTDGVLLWGAQLEEGSFPTSYIPNLSTTSGSTVTRNQDIFTRDGIGSLINSTEGVLFVEMAALSDDNARRTVSLSDGSNNNRVILRYGDSSNRVQGFIKVGGATNGSIINDSYTITNFLKIAYKWKAGDFALWINGTEVGTSADATSFGTGVLTELQFNQGDGTGDEYFGKVKQLQVYKTALTDTQLAALTS